MDLIPSFDVDHTDLQPGIYISLRDSVEGEAARYISRLTAAFCCDYPGI